MNDNLKEEISGILYTEVNENKEKVKLDLDCLNFEKRCYLINEILIKYNYFFRIFELKHNFRHLINENSNKKTKIRQVSRCVTKKSNGFFIVQVESVRKLRKKFLPINFIYEPVKSQNEKINCFFSNEMHLAYRSTFSHSHNK